MKAHAQRSLEVLPQVLERARDHCLPGRQSAAQNAIFWELHGLLRDSAPELPPSGCVLSFPPRS
jgi:hypothetical protein